MEHLNQTLFTWLNASHHPYGMVIILAIFLAEWLIWLVPASIGLCWLRGDAALRKTMLVASISGLLALLFAQLIGLAWMHPRPFMIGMGNTLIPHVADSSFPSDHLTLWWAVAFSFLLHAGVRRLGVVLALFGVPMAWSRIYLGVHFPLDMLGAAIVAAVSAWLALAAAGLYLEQLFQLASSIHRMLFSRLISIGWVRE
jgi:undecaprenyl-diphosphatase